jgi:hypothetical protein
MLHTSIVFACHPERNAVQRRIVVCLLITILRSLCSLRMTIMVMIFTIGAAATPRSHAQGFFFWASPVIGTKRTGSTE